MALSSACDADVHKAHDASLRHTLDAGPIAADAFDAGTDSTNPAAAARAACSFSAGALPEQTLDVTEPHGSQIPIDHFIVIMQENRSFDHYFEMLGERGVPDVEVAPKTFSNPNPDAGGAPITIFHETAYCVADIHHDANSVQAQYAAGSLSGFVASAQGDAHVMGYFDEADLPYYFSLATTFSIGDHYFSALLGPTWPNRMFAQSATSFGLTGNTAPPMAAEQSSLYHQLQQIDQPWMIYAEKAALEESIYPDLHSEPGDHFGSLDRFYADATSGNLPAFAWVESRLTRAATADDEHPPSDMQVGERFVANVIDAVMHGPAWSSSAVFLTYDEHGGFFDHVPPPSACPPDPGAADAATFSRYGMRVPFIVISPFSRAQHVSHSVLSHTSIMRMVQARFDLPALSARDANATPPFDSFDFTQPVFMTPPALADAVVDPTELARCKQLFP